MGLHTFRDSINCQLYTPQHPMNYLERRLPQETSYPISIGDDTWFLGGVIVCPGVTIGKRCIIGAGSVVVHDIPDDCLAVGNPAVIKNVCGKTSPLECHTIYSCLSFLFLKSDRYWNLCCLVSAF